MYRYTTAEGEDEDEEEEEGEIEGGDGVDAEAEKAAMEKDGRGKAAGGGGFEGAIPRGASQFDIEDDMLVGDEEEVFTTPARLLAVRLDTAFHHVYFAVVKTRFNL